jgi:hypothetical protein
MTTRKNTIVSLVVMMLMFVAANAQTYRNSRYVSGQVREISLNQLVAANNGNSTTTRTRATRQYAQAPQAQPQQNTAQQLADMATANEQMAVITGRLECAYVRNIQGDLELTVRTDGMYGGVYKFYLHGYNSNIELCPGDRIYFVARYNGLYDYPEVRPSEIVNPAGMVRYQEWYCEHYYGGNFGAMYSANPNMSKWGRIMNTVATTAVTVGSLIQFGKIIFGR